MLDPACGSGNFLYVTLEHLKRLEGEVLNQLADLGETQDKLGLEGETVTPKQFLGIELNRRAAALAELVLWIGHLQWHIRTQGNASVAEPVVHDFGNIENRDAVLAFDGQEPAFDPQGQLLSRWDGKTFKPHPVTGEQVPDEAAQEPQWRYLNPRAATWPQADYIVGNPPFIGARTIRAALGDGYLQALRSVYDNVPDNADFVMYWFDKAAQLVAEQSTRAFGLITTNSISQAFSRKVLDHHLAPNNGLSVAFAVPDHPWVDATDGAAIRIAMTVVNRSVELGHLAKVKSERSTPNGDVDIEFEIAQGRITSALKIGVDAHAASPLNETRGICSVGYQLSGQGFVVDAGQAESLDQNFRRDGAVIRELLTGKDITQVPRGLYAIDLYAKSAEDVRATYPAIYQWVVDRVKPERDQNARAALKDRWWIFGEARSTFRPALVGLDRMIACSLTAKHRVFQFCRSDAIADSTTVAFALSDSLHLGVISSNAHVQWALNIGSHLGVGNDPRYTKSKCFDPFPFPADDTGFATTSALADTIRRHAEAIDAHRKRVLASPEGVAAGLTLTGIYNVLEALRAGRALSAKEKLHHSTGLVGVLQSLHDELDAAVLQAYGWQDLGAVPWGEAEPQVAARQAWVEALLERLVALNTRRAADEARGLVRWLRPEFQDPAQRAALASPAETAEASVGAPAAMSDTTGDTNAPAP